VERATWWVGRPYVFDAASVSVARVRRTRASALTATMFSCDRDRLPTAGPAYRPRHDSGVCTDEAKGVKRVQSSVPPTSLPTGPMEYSYKLVPVDHVAAKTSATFPYPSSTSPRIRPGDTVTLRTTFFLNDLN